MNKYEIIWSPKAYEDLQNIYAYIINQLKEKYIANNIIKNILNSISSLSYLPERHTKVFKSKIRIKNLRKLHIDNYVVIYEVVHNTRPFILHIFHNAQNYLNLL